jgi:hypothetical protein
MTMLPSTAYAFCTAGCFASYFRNRCLVCERLYGRKAEHQWFCCPKCRVEFNRHPERFSGQTYRASVLLRGPQKSPIKGPGFGPTKAGRGFVQIAGPELDPTALRLAAIPLDPEVAARIARANAGFVNGLRKSKYAAARRAQIKRRPSAGQCPRRVPLRGRACDRSQPRRGPAGRAIAMGADRRRHCTTHSRVSSPTLSSVTTRRRHRRLSAGNRK